MQFSVCVCVCVWVWGCVCKCQKMHNGSTCWVFPVYSSFSYHDLILRSQQHLKEKETERRERLTRKKTLFYNICVYNVLILLFLLITLNAVERQISILFINNQDFVPVKVYLWQALAQSSSDFACLLNTWSRSNIYNTALHFELHVREVIDTFSIWMKTLLFLKCYLQNIFQTSHEYTLS